MVTQQRNLYPVHSENPDSLFQDVCTYQCYKTLIGIGGAVWSIPGACNNAPITVPSINLLEVNTKATF
jgi:hypothetical protein